MRGRIDSYLAPDTEDREAMNAAVRAAFRILLAIKIVRIGVACFLARQNADADTEIDGLGRSLDDLFFENRSNG